MENGLYGHLWFTGHSLPETLLKTDDEIQTTTTTSDEGDPYEVETDVESDDNGTDSDIDTHPWSDDSESNSEGD